MQTEIEAKFLNIDHDKVRAKLERLGAKCVHPVRLMRRKNFDYLDKRLEQKGGWIRVRDEGDKVTLCYKQLNDRTIHGTQEINVIVNEFEATCAFLEAIGLTTHSYQETKRESWVVGTVEVELDEWPWIPQFVELEGQSQKDVEDIAAKLGLDIKTAVHGSVEIAYQAVYDATEEEIDHMPEIVFGPVPTWLQERRK